MLSNELGMDVEQAKKLAQKIDSCISKEEKLYSDYNSIINNFNDSYISNNATKIQKNNRTIGDYLYTKKENIRSYKEYLDKYIIKYKHTGIQAVDTIKSNLKTINK